MLVIPPLFAPALQQEPHAPPERWCTLAAPGSLYNGSYRRDLLAWRLSARISGAANAGRLAPGFHHITRLSGPPYRRLFSVIDLFVDYSSDVRGRQVKQRISR
jgi:hypothetical protein